MVMLLHDLDLSLKERNSDGFFVIASGEVEIQGHQSGYNADLPRGEGFGYLGNSTNRPFSAVV